MTKIRLPWSSDGGGGNGESADSDLRRTGVFLVSVAVAGALAMFLWALSRTVEFLLAFAFGLLVMGSAGLCLATETEPPHRRLLTETRMA